jgi:hypothetical protein
MAVPIVIHYLLSICATTICVSLTESEIVATTFGEFFIGSPRNRIAATIEAATTTAPSILPFGCLR